MTADDLEMDLTVQSDGLRERDLSASLSNTRAQPAGKPLEIVRYNLSNAERMEMRERGGDVEDEFQMDFPIPLRPRSRAALAARARGGSSRSGLCATSSSRRAARRWPRSRRICPSSASTGRTRPTARPRSRRATSR
jgi:hypothetical protein